MDGEVIALIGALVAHGSLLWYKLGRCEQKVEDLAKTINGSKAGKQEGTQ